MPASVAQSDLRPSGDQEVAGSIPNRSGTGNILSWRQIMKYFVRSFSLFPSSESEKPVVSFWRNSMHKYWLTALRTEHVQEKCG